MLIFSVKNVNLKFCDTFFDTNEYEFVLVFALLYRITNQVEYDEPNGFKFSIGRGTTKSWVWLGCNDAFCYRHGLGLVGHNDARVTGRDWQTWCSRFHQAVEGERETHSHNEKLFLCNDIRFSVETAYK